MVKKMKEIGGKWYSRHEFSTYEYRVKVKFHLLDEDERSLDIYTTQTDKDEIRKAINSTLNREVCATFEIECYTTKAQDDATTEWLNEYFDLSPIKDDLVELEINAEDIPEDVLSNINSLDLRSDLENGNILGCVLRFEGYVGNRPQGFVGFHEDDSWAIDVLNDDGEPETSYLYVSELEYNQDYNLLKDYN